MAPLPKRKHSTARRGRRVSAKGKKLLGLVFCKNCHKPKLPHLVCKNCGK